MHQKDRPIPHHIPGKPWLSDMYMSNNKTNLQYTIIKLTDGLSADHLIKTCEIIFAECGLPRKINV